MFFFSFLFFCFFFFSFQNLSIGHFSLFRTWFHVLLHLNPILMGLHPNRVSAIDVRLDLDRFSSTQLDTKHERNTQHFTFLYKRHSNLHFFTSSSLEFDSSSALHIPPFLVVPSLRRCTILIDFNCFKFFLFLRAHFLPCFSLFDALPRTSNYKRIQDGKRVGTKINFTFICSFDSIRKVNANDAFNCIRLWKHAFFGSALSFDLRMSLSLKKVIPKLKRNSFGYDPIQLPIYDDNDDDCFAFDGPRSPFRLHLFEFSQFCTRISFIFLCLVIILPAAHAVVVCFI